MDGGGAQSLPSPLDLIGLRSYPLKQPFVDISAYALPDELNYTVDPYSPHYHTNSDFFHWPIYREVVAACSFVLLHTNISTTSRHIALSEIL